MPLEDPSSSSAWHTYIVCCHDGSLYTGVTTDLVRRVAEHNGEAAGDRHGARYTRSRRPVTLVYAEPHADRQSASRAEARIKRLDRPAKQRLILGT